MRWKVLLAIAALVLVLTIIQFVKFARVLFYLLFAGDVVSFLIAGGHGGTHMEDWVAVVLGFAVNVMVYSAVTFFLLTLFKKSG